MNTLKNLVVVALIMVGSSSFASGFRCEGKDVNVKLYNRTDSTRTPAVLLVSSTHYEPQTLLKRTNGEIKKVNRANSVQYIVEGNRALNADKVVLQISFKEGRETLEEGETVAGQLILINETGRDVYQLTCARYLKGE